MKKSLQPVCGMLNIDLLIASRVDIHTGLTEGENCYGIEKVRRLKEIMPDFEIEEFYSDSKSDALLAELAKESFIIIGNKILRWDA